MLLSPEHPELGQYSIAWPENLDQSSSLADYSYYRHCDDDSGHMTIQQIDEYNRGAHIILQVLKNWKARIRKDYKQQYTDALIIHEGLNFPETIKLALEHRKDAKPIPEGLLGELEKFNQILKGPE